MKTLKRLALTSVLLALMSGCSQDTTIEPAAAQRVEAQLLTAPEQVSERLFNGQVSVAEMTRMAFRIEGKLESLNVLPGQQVKKGQILARLDDDIPQQQWQDAKAQKELLQRQWQRSSVLLDKGLVAQAEFDELTAQLRLARVNLKSAEARLTYTELRAPFDGVVDALDKQAYETASPGETVMTLYRSDRTDVEMDIPDTLLSHAVNFIPNANYRPRVTVLGKEGALEMTYLEHSLKLDEQRGSYIARLAAFGTDLGLLPGQAVEVHLDLRQAGLPSTSGYRLPITALQSRGDQPGFQVWILQGETVQPVPVEVVQMGQEGALVVGRISSGDRVITTGLSRLRPNKRVVVVEKD
ncbi:efflux RND transporter periplasmic adaptor subunit [Ferrimonas futtsuensis]|uniref:efflux RND transporter periplasmic adaptor subunit n=1 Tax=Ferrimonas futtsuensis TaxID=364764 RepID=UPI00041D4635|nr:efflux RND transporter periplasmic adaptor subunit [Ferrimonas futtsuensis]